MIYKLLKTILVLNLLFLANVKSNYSLSQLEEHFLEACYCGDIKCVTDILIRYKINPNYKNDYGISPISAAVMGNNIRILNLLLNFGADVNLQNQLGESPIFHAIDQNNINIVRTLARNSKINLNIKNHIGQTPLIAAVMLDDAETSKHIVSILLNNENLNINEQDRFGFSALMIAASKDNLEIILLLIYHPNTYNYIDIYLKDNNSRNALYYASKYGRSSDLLFKKIYNEKTYYFANFDKHSTKVYVT